MSLWVQDPSFSNNVGTVDFAGVVLNPGFVGESGTVITINFRAVDPGQAEINFNSGSLLANDGSGTNILKSLGTASYNINAGVVEKPVVASSNAPNIFSDTHPDPKQWYTADTAHFLFDFPDEASEIRILLDQKPLSIPTGALTPLVLEKTFTNVPEGSSFLHLAYKTPQGQSSPGHFRINIDHSAPSSFIIQDSPGRDRSLSRVPLRVTAIDDISHIDHYEFVVDGMPAASFKPDPAGVYTLAELLPGTHVIKGKAYDAAGNSAQATLDFEIRGLSAPVISDYTKEIEGSEPVFVKGFVEPGYSAHLYMLDVAGHPVRMAETQSSSDGSFLLAWQPTSNPTVDARNLTGLRNMIVYGFSPDGHVTDPSTKLPIMMNKTPFLFVSESLLNVLLLVVPIIALIVLLIVLVLHALKKTHRFRDEIREEVREAEGVMHQAFTGIRSGLEQGIGLLEHANSTRHLTDEEKKLFKMLRQNLNDAERLIGKEMVKVEKKVSKR